MRFSKLLLAACASIALVGQTYGLNLPDGAIDLTHRESHKHTHRHMQTAEVTAEVTTRPLSNTTYNNTGAECNFFKQEGLETAPWPKDCQNFKRDECSMYEISKDGKSIESCELSCPSIGKVKLDTCEGYYDKYSSQDEELIFYRFPDKSKACNFTSAKYPLKPWPRNCKIYQADDVCNTYEIADSGRWIASCDIALVEGECIATNMNNHTCIEECPAEGCGNDLAVNVKANMMVIIAMFASIIAFTY